MGSDFCTIQGVERMHVLKGIVAGLVALLPTVRGLTSSQQHWSSRETERSAWLATQIKERHSR